MMEWHDFLWVVFLPVMWQLYHVNHKLDSLKKQFDIHDKELHDHIYVKRKEMNE